MSATTTEDRLAAFEYRLALLERRLQVPVMHDAETVAASIVAAVAEEFGTTGTAMLGESAARDEALPRHLAMALIRNRLGWSLKRIGNAFGGRDHTTVLYALRRIRALRATEPAFAGRCDRIAKIETEMLEDVR